MARASPSCRAALHLSYRGDHLDAGLLAAQLPDPRPGICRRSTAPIPKLPRLYARGSWRLPGALPLDLWLRLRGHGFAAATTCKAGASMPRRRSGSTTKAPGYFVRPAVALEATQYRLRDTLASVDDRSPTARCRSRASMAACCSSADSGSRGQRRMTLEPRLMYLYAPYRDQDNLPVFDTAEPDLNWVELFRTNRYVGLDRISDANQVSAPASPRAVQQQQRHALPVHHDRTDLLLPHAARAPAG